MRDRAGQGRRQTQRFATRLVRFASTFILAALAAAEEKKPPAVRRRGRGVILRRVTASRPRLPFPSLRLLQTGRIRPRLIAAAVSAYRTFLRSSYTPCFRAFRFGALAIEEVREAVLKRCSLLETTPGCRTLILSV